MAGTATLGGQSAGATPTYAHQGKARRQGGRPYDQRPGTDGYHFPRNAKGVQPARAVPQRFAITDRQLAEPTQVRLLLARTREGRVAESTQLHVAGDRISIDSAGTVKCHGHGLRYLRLPTNRVAISFAIFECNTALSTRHGAGDCVAIHVENKFPFLCAHGGLSGDTPGSCNAHRGFPVRGPIGPCNELGGA